MLIRIRASMDSYLCSTPFEKTACTAYCCNSCSWRESTGSEGTSWGETEAVGVTEQNPYVVLCNVFCVGTSSVWTVADYFYRNSEQEFSICARQVVTALCNCLIKTTQMLQHRGRQVRKLNKTAVIHEQKTQSNDGKQNQVHTNITWEHRQQK